MSPPKRETAGRGADIQSVHRSRAGRFASVRRHALGVAAFSTGLGAPSVLASRAVLAVIFGAAAIAAAIAYLPTIRVGEVPRRLRNPISVAAAITMAAWLVSAFAGINLGWSLFVWSTTAGLLLMAGLLFAAFDTEDWIEPHLLRTLVATSLAFAVAGAVAIWLWPVVLDPAGVRGIVGIHNAREALKSYGSLIPCLVFAVLWAGFRLGGGWRAAGVLYAGLGPAIVYRAEALSGMLGFAVAGVVLALTWACLRLPRRARPLFAAVLAMVVVAGAVVIVKVLPMPGSPGPVVYRIPIQLVDRHRQVIWGFVLHHGAKAPILGHGPGNARHLPGATQNVAGVGTYVPSHPHNWLIQVFAETGLVGLAALLAVLFILLRRLVWAAGRGDTAGWAGIGVTAAFFGSWLSNFSFWAAWWQAAYFLLMVIILGSIARNARIEARAD